MNRLYQKNHGLPGIGIFGDLGKTGENGKSIYVGFINDFFNSTVIKGSILARSALRLIDRGENPEYITKKSSYIASLDDAYTYAKNIYGEENATLCRDYILNILNNKSMPEYYTGMQASKELIDTLVGENTPKDGWENYNLDIANNYLAMVKMVSSLEPMSDEAKFSDITIKTLNIAITDTNITIDGVQYNYVDLYNYNTDGLTYKLDTSINWDLKTITFSSLDAAWAMNDSLEMYNDLISRNVSDASAYTILDANMSEIEDSTKYSDKKYFVKEVFNGYGNDEAVNNSSLWALDTNRGKLVIDEAAVGTYTTFADYNYASTDIENHKHSYVKSAAILDAANIYNEEFIIDNKAYYGVNLHQMYEGPALNPSYGDSMLGETEIIASTSTSLLYKKYNNVDYVNAMTTYILNISSNIANPTFDGVISWTADTNNDITIPTTLSADYKEGDVIYFYTNNDLAHQLNNATMEYMVVITKDMENCTVEQFIANAVVVDPLTIKYFTAYNNRLQAALPIGTYKANLKTNSVNYKINQFSAKSINNLINKDDNNKLVISSVDSKLMEFGASDNSTNISKLFVEVNDTNSTKKVVNVNAVDASNNTNTLKLDSMMISNHTLSEHNNLDAAYAVYDQNMIITNGFIKPLTSINQYSINGLYYLGNDISMSDYFTTYDKNNCLLGFELYNDAGQLIETNVTSDESLSMLITLINPDESNYVENQVSYSVAKTISIISDAAKLLDWDDNTEGGKVYNYIGLLIVNNYLYFAYESDDHIKIFVSLLDKECYSTAHEDKYGIYHYKTPMQVGDSPVYTGNVKKLTTIYQNEVSITKDAEVYEETESIIHIVNYVQLFAANTLGVKFYSKPSKISYDIVQNKLANIMLENLSGDIYEIESSTTEGNIKFATSNITAEALTDVSLNIMPVANASVKIKKIYFNYNTLEDADLPYWINVNETTSEDNFYTYNINLASNIPSVIDETDDATSILFNTVKDFEKCLADEAENTECELFVKLNNNVKVASTKDRYIVITAEYVLINNNDESEVMREQYKLILPGFEDTRDVPQIKLNLHNKMEQIEQYNKLENNVLCNQFVTYMDIEIDNFAKYWSKFNDSSTSIDLKIENIMSDLNWAEKYNKPGTNIRNTIKVVNNDYSEGINNYISLLASIVNPTDDTPITDNDMIDVSTRVAFLNADSAMAENILENSVLDINNNKYVLCDSNVMQYLNDPKSMYKGINEHIAILINKAPISYINDKAVLRVKLLFEFGNPMIANLYLRFAVTELRINVCDNTTFTTFKPAISTSGVSTYLYTYDSKNRTENYRFISEPLDVTVNPISYIACPEELEQNLTNITGNIKKSGPEFKLYTGSKFYELTMYNEDPFVLVNNNDIYIRNNKWMPWSNFKVAKKYLLDNVQNITISPVKLRPASNKYFINELNAELITNLPLNVDEINNKDYLSVVYNASIMNCKKQDNKYVFTYNNTIYQRDRYNQLNDRYPIFTSDLNNIEVRSESLVDAMNSWNFEYANSNRNVLDNTFTGVLNNYGNGYTYLDNSYDENQYGTDHYSLQATKALNNLYVYDCSTYNEIEFTCLSNFEPYSSGYFRSFLYDIMWDYPVSLEENVITPYSICSNFDYLMQYLDKTSEVPQEYQTEYEENIKDKKMIPYSSLFDINPRVAYNVDNNTINVFMLRRPTITTDNDKINECYKNYRLNKHFFTLSNGLEIQRLEGPYLISE